MDSINFEGDFDNIFLVGVVDLPEEYSTEYYLKWISFSSFHLTKTVLVRDKNEVIEELNEFKKSFSEDNMRIKSVRVYLKDAFDNAYNSIRDSLDLGIRDTVLLCILNIKKNPTVFYK